MADITVEDLNRFIREIEERIRGDKCYEDDFEEFNQGFIRGIWWVIGMLEGFMKELDG